MKRLFHITSGAAAHPADVLLCELSQHHVALARATAASKEVTQVSYYEFRSPVAPDKFADVLAAEEFVPNAQGRLVLCNALTQAVLIPSAFFSIEKAKTLYAATSGGEASAFFFDDIRTHDLVLTHAVPQGLMDILKSWAGVQTMHAHSCQLRSVDGAAAHQITLHFTNKEIQVTAVKSGALQGAQTYLYTAPMDVVYYLLALCKEYGLPQSGTAVIVSGLVSEDSAVYKEVCQYFSDVQFWKPQQTAVLSDGHPPHFFSSLYNLAACVL